MDQFPSNFPYYKDYQMNEMVSTGDTEIISTYDLPDSGHPRIGSTLESQLKILKVPRSA